ncbi:alpha/beta hydrolase [Prevotella falsenii]|uniref:alpha/beta hydrolase n=1 Tax=Prevotella falsenii TaxID=515414 RepID=UPI0009FDA614|nr:alpha/beta hydrolase-fold protein [Prevotella falsenii]
MKSKSLILALFVVALVSCSEGAESVVPAPEPQQDEQPQDERPQHYTTLVSKTTPYPDAYEQEAKQRGQVVELQYATRDYAEGTGAARNNTANVYLPYGYDADTGRRYNILYLVHGHYGDASTFLTADGGLLRKVLDNMIEHADIEPLIVVTPTYNYGRPTPNYVDADRYCRALPQELQHDLIPVVESRYRTYALTADSVGLTASRHHRAIGGFSMGGVTTWYALDETLSMFRWFLPMSGDSWSLGAFAGMNRPTETSRYLEQRIQQQGYGTSDFYIWAASGTSDSAYRETLNQIEGMASAGSFFNLQNMSFHEKDGARHEYRPMTEYVYNALPFFFPKRSNP